MARPPVKFFQVGSFAAGNRLLDEDARSVQAGHGRSNALTKGTAPARAAARRSAHDTSSTRRCGRPSTG